jgi:hypothetical protein
MAEASMRTRNKDSRHTKSETNRNRAESFGGALTTRRHGASDSPGASSSRSRSATSGAERDQSVMAGRGGSGTSGGAGSSRVSEARGMLRGGNKPRRSGTKAPARGKPRSKKSR